jgi:hypothetical protein
MTLRKVTSLTAFLAFIVMVVTGIVLYVVPQGRVAYWAEWRFLGGTKETWGALHILIGLLFLAAGILHIVLNWKPMVSYMKDRARQVKVFTPSFTVALLLTALFTAGAVADLPPFSWVMDWNGRIKDAQSRRFGEPPYGHAELSSLRVFADRVHLDLPRALDLLSQKGVRVEGPDQTLAAIARDNGLTPQQVYEIVRPAELAGARTAPGTLPEEAAPGLGRKTLKDLCGEYGLDPEKVAAALQARGVPADPDRTVKENAEEAGMGPHDYYDVIREVSRPGQPAG